MPKRTLARELTLREGGKVSTSVAQVSEVLARLGDLMVEDPAWTLGEIARFVGAAVRRARKRDEIVGVPGFIVDFPKRKDPFPSLKRRARRK